jgi:hypothetical protein
MEMVRPDAASGLGEARERARLRKRTIVFGAIFAAGLIGGFYVGFQEAGRVLHGGDGAWSPAVALVLAGLYLTAIVAGSLLLQVSMDELERHNGYKAGTFAAAVYIVVYPIWFLLWKGGFVAEPIHWLVFIIFWLALLAGHLWYRFR